MIITKAHPNINTKENHKNIILSKKEKDKMEALIYSGIGAVTGAVGSGLAALGLSAAGFSAGGVVAGSAAAAAQAAVGNVAAGSAFAVLQSVAATGAIATAAPVVIGVGAALGLGGWAVLLLI